MRKTLLFIVAISLTIMSGFTQNLILLDSAAHFPSRDTTLMKAGTLDDSKEMYKNMAVKNNSISATPNPADVEINFTYTILPGSTGKIIILQITGTISSEIPVQGTHGIVVVNTREMKDGLYFYCLHVDGKVYSAKKFVVRHI